MKMDVHRRYIFLLEDFVFYEPQVSYQRLTLDLSQRAILLTGKDIGLPLLENIVVRSYLPHSQVFPRCTVLIHHGGIGTTGQALIAGRPQLVVTLGQAVCYQS